MTSRQRRRSSPSPSLSPSSTRHQPCASAMAAPRRSAPIYVLNGTVEQLTGDPGQGRRWKGSRSTCASATPRSSPPPWPSARVSDEALRALNSSVRHELGDRRKMYAVGRIVLAEQGLFVVVVIFHLECGRDLAYFLVYDDVDASLSMMNYLTDLYEASNAYKSLLFMAQKSPPGPMLQFVGLPPVLCVFSPAAGAADDTACPWRVRDPFIADAAFPLHGKGFWGDVTQGLVHFDLRAATSDGDPAAVDFGFIELPRECQLDLGQMLKVRDERTTLTRTMARVGESIWFVCIDQAEQVADDVLTMWTLELPGERWKKEWEGGGVAGRGAGVPYYPVLTADGALFVVMIAYRGRRSRGDPLVGHVCSVDVLNKRLLCHGLVHDYPFCDPVIFPSDFFRREHGSGRTKLEEHLPPAAGPASLAGSKGSIMSQGAC
uniref:DUF1618 domain-containing protein n=1 Tax=Setaria italica TaxID=4555 RepID=K4AJI8_SETIT